MRNLFNKKLFKSPNTANDTYFSTKNDKCDGGAKSPSVNLKLDSKDSSSSATFNVLSPRKLLQGSKSSSNNNNNNNNINININIPLVADTVRNPARRDLVQTSLEQQNLNKIRPRNTHEVHHSMSVDALVKKRSESLDHSYVFHAPSHTDSAPQIQRTKLESLSNAALGRKKVSSESKIQNASSEFLNSINSPHSSSSSSFIFRAKDKTVTYTSPDISASHTKKLMKRIGSLGSLSRNSSKSTLRDHALVDPMTPDDAFSPRAEMRSADRAHPIPPFFPEESSHSSSFLSFQLGKPRQTRLQENSSRVATIKSSADLHALIDTPENFPWDDSKTMAKLVAKFTSKNSKHSLPVTTTLEKYNTACAKILLMSAKSSDPALQRLLGSITEEQKLQICQSEDPLLLGLTNLPDPSRLRVGKKSKNRTGGVKSSSSNSSMKRFLKVTFNDKGKILPVSIDSSPIKLAEDFDIQQGFRERRWVKPVKD